MNFIISLSDVKIKHLHYITIYIYNLTCVHLWSCQNTHWTVPMHQSFTPFADAEHGQCILQFFNVWLNCYAAKSPEISVQFAVVFWLNEERLSVVNSENRSNSLRIHCVRREAAVNSVQRYRDPTTANILSTGWMRATDRSIDAKPISSRNSCYLARASAPITSQQFCEHEFSASAAAVRRRKPINSRKHVLPHSVSSFSFFSEPRISLTDKGESRFAQYHLKIISQQLRTNNPENNFFN